MRAAVLLLEVLAAAIFVLIGGLAFGYLGGCCQ